VTSLSRTGGCERSALALTSRWSVKSWVVDFPSFHPAFDACRRWCGLSRLMARSTSPCTTPAPFESHIVRGSPCRTSGRRGDAAVIAAPKWSDVELSEGVR